MENISNNFTPLNSYKTDLNADSIEWCPHAPNQNVFVCGNYELIERTEDIEAKRLGKILLFTFFNEDLRCVQTLETSGVLDQKWCYNKINGHSILGVATAVGEILLYKLNSDQITLELVCVSVVTTSDIVVLSLDWSDGIFDDNEPHVICSDSKGSIHLLKFCDDNLSLLRSWKGHANSRGNLSFEAWVAGFYYWDPNIFFSGGDDASFLMYDSRSQEEYCGKNNCHQAGVTSLHSNSSKEYVLATGSYDQHVRLWDIRSIKKEISIVKMPGEVWRLKWEPYTKKLLLAACMYDGVHIVDLTTVTDGKIVGSYYEHKNISYGVDWSYLHQYDSTKLGKDEYIIGSCSFYDRTLCISKFHNKNDT